MTRTNLKRFNCIIFDAPELLVHDVNLISEHGNNTRAVALTLPEP